MKGTELTPIDAIPEAVATDEKPVDKSAPKCVACGRWHGGGGNLEILCLRREVLRLRAELAKKS